VRQGRKEGRKGKKNDRKQEIDYGRTKEIQWQDERKRV
jgi:hypothetical protein